MLDIKNLSLKIERKQILNDVSLLFKKGKNYCLLGKNGSGKSSLALAIMGHPQYTISTGDIIMEGESILKLSPAERAQKGIFLAFQKIPEIKGVKLFEFLRVMYNQRWWKKESFVWFKRLVLPYLEELGIDKEFLRREVNVWFSGGERRKVEILQLKLLEPSYIFLDEVDSGLDIDAFKSVIALLQKINNEKNTFIIITHYFTILDYMEVDEVIIMQEGKVQEVWWKELIEKVREKGFGKK